MRRSAVGGVLLVLAPLRAVAAPQPSAALPNTPPPIAVSSEPATSETCVERIPRGKERPKIEESLPSRGTSGHALTLALTLEHGKGETVLPGGFDPQTESPEWRALKAQGLYLPDPNGGAGPLFDRRESGERATTSIRISFVPLPDKPGRNLLVVPPLPISIARASGEVLVLCTRRHEVSIEDPIANVPNPSPKPNPPPRKQREEWTALKHAVYAGLAALVVGAFVAWLVGKWLKRARPLPPPPPPRPPWEVALEELYDLRHAGLVGEGRFAEHFDRVSDIVRKYLGARFGFDGLESTTREALFVLRRLTPPLAPLESIEAFLGQADLVKFAHVVPSAEDCDLALARAERIIGETLPAGAAVRPAAAPTRPEPERTPAAPGDGV